MPHLFDVLLHATAIRLRHRGFRSRWFGSVGRRIHVWESRGDPDGPDILMVHGIGASAASMAPALLRLAPHARRLWAIDLPGHGFSDLPEPLPSLNEASEAVFDAFDQLIEGPVVLYGASLGGAVSMKYTLARPDKVRRLVLMAPAGAPMSPTVLADVDARFSLQSARDGRRFLEALYHNAPWYRFIIGGSITHLLSRPMVRHLFNSITVDDMLSPEEAAELSLPILLIWGESERILPEECLRWYRRHLPAHTVFRHPVEFGHSPHLEYPSTLVNMVLDFLDVR